MDRPQRFALLVDDSEIALRHLEIELHRLGLRTECAKTSQQAEQKLGQMPFDVVFIDVELGDASTFDGLELCRRIRRAGGPRPRCVLVSAHQAEVDRARGALAGCDAYLGKPLRAGELAQVLFAA